MDLCCPVSGISIGGGKITGAGNLHASSNRIGKNKKEAYYYGQVFPEEITLRFRLKNG